MPGIELSNIELHYEEYGDGEDIVVLLHCFLSSSKMWLKDYIPDLSKRYKVYTIDLRGHGNSHTVKEGCNLDQMATDLHQFLLSKDIDKCILAGMSMGGAVAIQSAINFPERIKALILMNPGAGSVFSKGFLFISPILSFLAQKKLLLRPFLKSVLVNPLPGDKLSEFVDDAALVGKETWLQYLNPENKIRNYDRLKTMNVRTLVIIGEKDNATAVRFQENVAETIPDAVKVMIRNEGHAIAMENPGKVLSEIDRFLTGV